MKCRLLQLLVLIFLASNALTQRSTWPMISGDAMRTSNADIELSFPLRIAETWDLGLKREDGMIVTEDYLFFTNIADSNVLIGVNIHTGEPLWQFGVPGSGGSANFVPAAWQHLVIAGGQGGDGIYALHRETGEVQWFKDTGTAYARCPIITDGLLLIPGGEGLLCVDLANGEDQWSIDGGFPQISPVADNSLVYFGKDGDVHAVSKWTGVNEWSTSVANGNFSSYALDEQRLYVSYQSQEINALDKSDGAVVWTVKIDSIEKLIQYPSTFAQTEDNLIVKFIIEENNRNQYMVLDKATGTEVDRFEGGGMNYGGPTIINDYVVDLSGGNLIFWTIPSGDTAYIISIDELGSTDQIIAAHGRIYIGAKAPSIHVLESVPVATRDIETKLELNVYPNPASNMLNVDFALDSKANVRIEIASLDGVTRRVKKSGSMVPGKYSITIPLSNLGVGVYWLSLYAGEQIETLQFVRQ